MSRVVAVLALRELRRPAQRVGVGRREPKCKRRRWCLLAQANTVAARRPPPRTVFRCSPSGMRSQFAGSSSDKSCKSILACTAWELSFLISAFKVSMVSINLIWFGQRDNCAVLAKQFRFQRIINHGWTRMNTDGEMTNGEWRFGVRSAIRHSSFNLCPSVSIRGCPCALQNV